MSIKEIEKRWKERVVPNGWNKTSTGADEYVKRYGNNISQDKLKAFHSYALSVGSVKFANGLKKYLFLDKITPTQKGHIASLVKKHGLDNTVNSVSFDSIKDHTFHDLVTVYAKAADRLKFYIGL